MGGRAAPSQGLGGRLSASWTPHGTLGGGGWPPFPEEVVTAAAALDLGPEVVELAWEISRLLVAPAADPRARALLWLALAMLAAQRDGSTRLPLVASGPLPALLASLGARETDQAGVRALLAAARSGDAHLRHLFGSGDVVAGDPGDYRPLLIADDHLYSQRLWELERRVVGRLRDLLSAPLAVDAVALEQALRDLRARPAMDAAGKPVQLTTEQEAAVRVALGGRLTAVTGGPGTGKTWIVAALLRVVARLGDPPLAEVALAAPTGKAADRLQGSLRAALNAVADPAEADRRLLASPLVAATLHRLLSYSPSGERFLRHERNPLPERLVLVDESSMVDLAIAERLLRSLPAGGRLVLLGDANQLPSVEAGAVFRDLVEAAGKTPRVARLTHSWRMDPRDPAGSAILTLAASIAADGAPLQGNTSAAPGATAPTTRERATDLAFAGAELLLSPPASLASFLARWWQERVQNLPAWSDLVDRTWTAVDGAVVAGDCAALDALFAHYQASRLLTPTRGWTGGTGVAALNAWFRATLLRALASTAGSERPRGEADQPLAGEPVLITRNDYRRSLYNGDQGLVLRVAAEGERAVAMAVLRSAGARSGFRALPLAALRSHLEPAWASTVHKAQGSEHDAVAMILPATSSRLLTRELLYTAVTRARRSVVLVGTAEILAATAGRAAERWSGIAEALAGSGPATAQPLTPSPRRQLTLFPD